MTMMAATELCGCVVQYHPQLTRGLSGPWEDVSARFDRRVRDALPEGLPEAAAMDRLRKQGFLRGEANGRALPGEVEWFRSESNFACNIAARIYWRLDTDGRIFDVRGTYNEEGCL
jgi:hypothetical protein